MLRLMMKEEEAFFPYVFVPRPGAETLREEGGRRKCIRGVANWRRKPKPNIALSIPPPLVSAPHPLFPSDA